MAQDANESTRVMTAAGAPPIDRTMVAGGSGGGAAAIQMGQMVSCAVCHTSNSAMETYCVECGFLLASAPGQVEEVDTGEGTEQFSLVENGSGRRFPLRAGPNTVGRENSDILLMDGTVSRRHATVTVSDGQVTVTDLGSTNGTQVNGNGLAADQPVTLSLGDTVRFGNASLTFAGIGEEELADEQPPADKTMVVEVGAPPEALTEATLIDAPHADVREAAPEEPEPPVASQVLQTPAPSGEHAVEEAWLRPSEGAGQPIGLVPGTVTVGRRTGNDVVLSGDPYVSSRHAELLCDATGCYIVDLGSTNGTMVNGRKLTPDEKQLLLDGDEVVIGQTTYRFETAGPGEDHAAAEPATLGEPSAEDDMAAQPSTLGEAREAPRRPPFGDEEEYEERAE